MVLSILLQVMEKDTPLFPIPSLYTGASMSAVIHLRNQQLYRNSRTNPSKFLSDVAELENKIYCLPIAATQKRILLSFVHPLTKYLDHWLVFWHYSLCAKREPIKNWLDKLNLIKNMRTTLLGTVDGRTTAKEILESGTLSDEDAFRLACINCMPNEVMSLWPRVKSYFVNKVYNRKDFSESSEVIVFSRYANEANSDENENLNLFTFRWHDCSDAWYEFAVRSAVKVGNELAMDYFLNEIKSDKREKIVLGVAESVFNGLWGPHNAVSIRLVISHLGLQKWCEFVKTHAKYVFLTFTVWPMWIFFFEMALESRRNLTSKQLLDMLARLATHVEPSENGPIGDYLLDQVKYIFEAVWNDTSHEQKLEVIQSLLAYDTNCQIRSSSTLHNEMIKNSWVFEEAFIHSEALYNFLYLGFRKNTTCLRKTLYKYLPSCKDSKEVESMLNMYEDNSLQN